MLPMRKPPPLALRRQARRRRDQSFTQRDLTRAIRAAQAANLKARFEVDTTKKTITVIPDDAPAKPGDAGNPLDNWMESRASQTKGR
jgi:hypothetical protein